MRGIGSDGDNGVEIKAAACCSVCPSKAIIVKEDGNSQQIMAGSTAEAIESASTLLNKLSPGGSLTPARIVALTAKFEGDTAVRSGDWATAIAQYEEALSSEAAATTLGDPSRAQPPSDGATLEWESTVWNEALYNSELTFDESVTTFEFGTCADGAVLLTDAAVSDDDDGGGLTGEIETPDGFGTFDLRITEDGKSFAGVLVLEDGVEQSWTARRCASDGGGGADDPAPGVRWIMEALVRRSEAHVALGDGSAALADAEKSVMLCCRVPSCWDALANAAATVGDEARERAARGEARWLRGEDSY